jgi:hypothetical protein
MKKLIWGLFSNSSLRAIFFFNRQKELSNWNIEDYTDQAPHLLKQNLISYYRVKLNYRILIETGTYLGEMVLAQMNWFDKIYSIELDKKLYRYNKKQFGSNKKIELIQGDSGKSLKYILDIIDKPAIIFLDGHYSGGITAKGELMCPIYNELDLIFNSNLPHLIIIDDRRLFNGNDDYPIFDDLKAYINLKKSNLKIDLFDDLIIIEQ